MFLTIVTPVTRYGNLFLIERSLKTIPRENRRWICVFDNNHIPQNIPKDCEAYICKDINSKMENAQRNYALDLIKTGHVYFNDDDTTVHENLWKGIERLEQYDFIHFSQMNKNGGLRLKGKEVKLGSIDSHNFIVSRECIGNTRWELNKYAADGKFAEECYKKAGSTKFIPKVLSVYNSLQ